MPRPRCCRRIGARPPSPAFRPVGVPRRFLEEVRMSLDEFEAIRLADDEGLYQAAAAERMGVSRATFGRILESARRAVASALVHGRLLRIVGGPVEHIPGCPACGAATSRPCERCCESEHPEPRGRRARWRQEKEQEK